ncbi:MAG: helix-turn-helix domain-containing protein [Deltaproteobacteria bacterium]|nr:helix-turn-helix domain-containing protein [Deltaproteobacteria bacterium]
MPDVKDFELSLRLRNNHLKSRRLKLNLTQRQLAQRIGVTTGAYGGFESLRVSPLNNHLKKETIAWKPSAQKIAKFYGCDAAELWPGAVLAVTVPEIITEVGAEQLLPPAAVAALLPEPATSPEDEVQSSQAADAVRKALDLLPKEHAEVLRRRFGIGNADGPMELAEVGRALPKANGHPRSRERIRQMEARALRYLHHSSYGKALRHFAAELPGIAPERDATPSDSRWAQIESAVVTLENYISRWARRNQRPIIRARYLRHHQELYDALCGSNDLRGARVQSAPHLSANASVLKTTRSARCVAQWVSKTHPKIGEWVLAYLHRPVFFIMLEDEHGPELFRFWMGWVDVKEDGEGDD